MKHTSCRSHFMHEVPPGKAISQQICVCVRTILTNQGSSFPFAASLRIRPFLMMVILDFDSKADGATRSIRFQPASEAILGRSLVNGEELPHGGHSPTCLQVPIASRLRFMLPSQTEIPQHRLWSEMEHKRWRRCPSISHGRHATSLPMAFGGKHWGDLTSLPKVNSVWNCRT